MTLFVDLHVHTSASDGALSPNQLAKMINNYYVRTGKKIYVIATDHDTVKGQEHLLKSNYEVTWPEVYAMEKTTLNHINFAGKKYPVHTNIFCPFAFTSKEVPYELHEQGYWAEKNGCIIQLNHPFFWPNKLMINPSKFMREVLSIPRVKLIEVSNANETWLQDWLTLMGLARVTRKFAVPTPFSFKRVLKKLSRNLDVNLVANTDMHVPMSFAANFNVVHDGERLIRKGWSGFEQAIKEKKIVAFKVKRAPLCLKLLMLTRWYSNPMLNLYKILPCGVEKEAFKAWWTSNSFTL